MGCGTILVDGQIAQRRLCGWWSTPPLTFRVGPSQALLTIRVWPWLTIRALKLIVAGQVLYTEGQADQSVTPEEMAEIIAASLRVAQTSPGVVAKARVPMPPKVTCQKQLGGVSLTRRWFSGVAIFLAIASLLGNGLILAALTLIPDTYAPWFPRLILLPLLGAGLCLAYYAAARLFNSTVIQLTPSQLSIRHRPLPWPGNRSLPVSGLEQLYCKRITADQEDEMSASYSLLAILNHGQEIELLNGIESPETVRYLEQEIETWLGIKDAAVAGELLV
jgi:hypothetical protein